MTGFDNSHASLAELAKTAELLHSQSHANSELSQELTKLRARHPTARDRTANTLAQLSRNMDRFVQYKLSAPPLRVTVPLTSRRHLQTPDQTAPRRHGSNAAVSATRTRKPHASPQRDSEPPLPIGRKLAALAITAASRGIIKIARWIQS